MSASGSKPRFTGAVFNGDHHVCAFFHNKDEEFRMLAPFIVEGLESGEKAIHIINVNLRQAYRRRMTEVGIDVDAVERSGQLAVTSWPTGRQHAFIDQDESIKLIDHLLIAAREGGYRRTRIVGEMDCAPEDHILDS